MSNYAQTKADEAADRLIGTAQSIHDLGEEFEALQNEKDFCERLDELCFCCEVCGWYCGEDEYSDKDMTCNECYDGEEDVD